MKYERIKVLPEDSVLNEIVSGELDALANVWREKKDALEADGEYKAFIRKLQREWAIETGIIERLYSWDRGVTEILIEQGIESSLISHRGGVERGEAEHIKKIIDDQLTIVEGLFSYIKGENPFSEHFIRGLHSQFAAHQDFTDAMTPDGKIIQIPLLKGEYKKNPNNPKRPNGTIHEYCPPEFVKEEMERLVTIYKENEQNLAPEILSAWVHHRFTQIHPFQDGNGRVARALASLVFLKDGLFPLIIRDKERKEYIQALEEADRGDIQKLTTLFAGRQRDSLLAALGIQQQLHQAQYATQIIDSTLALLKNKYASHRDRAETVHVIAKKLHEIIREKLFSIAESIDEQLQQINSPNDYQFSATMHDAPDEDSSHNYYFYHQIAEVAQKFDYFANLDEYKSWVRLRLSTEKTFEIVFSIHGYGHFSNDIMVVSALTLQRVKTEEGGGHEPINTMPATPHLFQFNYAESEENIKKRFSGWFEDSLSIALAEWNRTITA
ncbi:MAG: Fic family protein [bacterium]|nr:Fic family protein [bacterium]